MSESKMKHTMPALSKKKFELLNGFISDEKCLSQVLHVVSGTAWVTMDGKDIIVNAGEEIRLACGKYDAIVSSANHDPVVYEIAE